MRKLILLLSLSLLSPALIYAQSATTTSAGATVTYSPSTELSCTDNATLNGDLCYCNKGFHVSATSCVPDVAAVVATSTGPTGPEIYQDIEVSVQINSELDLTCQQMGFVAPTELDMCTRFKAASDDERATWKVIPRPSTAPSTMIANPWAPASQQAFQIRDASGTVALLPLTPAPAPPPPAPPPAPEPLPPPPPPDPPPPPPTPPPPPPPVEPAPLAADMPAPKTDEELATAPVAETPSPPPENTEMPSPQFGDLSSMQFASAAAASDALDVSSITEGLGPLSDDEKIPVPEQAFQEPVKSTSLLARIAGWFLGLF